MTEANTVDVVVVGGGTGGLVAALTAREAGARVLLLEAAPREERGGNSRFASGIFRFAHRGVEDIKPLLTAHTDTPWDRIEVEPYDESRFYADIWRSTRGQADPCLLRTVIDRSAEAMQWLRDRGVRWTLAPTAAGMGPAGERRHLTPGSEIMVDGNGSHLIEALYTAAEIRGVNIWYDAPALGLLTEGFTATGVTIVRDGECRTVRATSVILASGSIEASAEARLRYLGTGWDTVRVRGTRFNTGIMLDRAIAAGAAASGHWGGAHAVAVDADSTPFGDLSVGDSNARYSFPFGVTVNIDSARFFDEGRDEVAFTYAEVGRLLLHQPAAIGVQLFDSKTIGMVEPRYSTATAVVANTHRDLAERLDLDPDLLGKTLADFNAACQDGPVDPTRKDGVFSRPHGQPAKSNWAQPLDSPPFYGFRITSGITFAFAGLAIDADAQVQAFTGRSMDGLYACGEIAGGIIAHNVPSGMGLMKSTVTGLLAGACAATTALTG